MARSFVFKSVLSSFRSLASQSIQTNLHLHLDDHIAEKIMQELLPDDSNRQKPVRQRILGSTIATFLHSGKEAGSTVVNWLHKKWCTWIKGSGYCRPDPCNDRLKLTRSLSSLYGVIQWTSFYRHFIGEPIQLGIELILERRASLIPLSNRRNQIIPI